MIKATHCNNCHVQMLGKDPILDYEKGECDGTHQFYHSEFCHLCEVDKHDALHRLRTGRDRVTAAPVFAV